LYWYRNRLASQVFRLIILQLLQAKCTHCSYYLASSAINALPPITFSSDHAMDKVMESAFPAPKVRLETLHHPSSTISPTMKADTIVAHFLQGPSAVLSFTTNRQCSDHAIQLGSSARVSHSLRQKEVRPSCCAEKSGGQRFLPGETSMCSEV